MPVARAALRPRTLVILTAPQVSLYCDCPLWPDDGMCSMRDCSVCECEDDEVPKPWKEAEAACNSAGGATHKLSCRWDRCDGCCRTLRLTPLSSSSQEAKPWAVPLP